MSFARSIISGTNNYIGNGSDRIALINCHQCTTEPGMSGLTAINCSGFQFTWEHNYRVVVDNRIVVNQKSTSIDSSAVNYIRGEYGMYYCDASGGSMTVIMPNPLVYLDCEITFKRIDNAVSNIRFNAFNGELLEFAASPYISMATQGDRITWTSNGTDWFIKGT